MSSKPKNCSKVKNACKYCLEQVTNRNGLQCQGACRKWAHFKCLNYTPGKISDIKAGIIKVMCPCPDCETSQTKEFLANPPYSCSNHNCPANIKGPVKCDSAECPSNRKKNDPMTCSNRTCPKYAAPHPQKKPPPRSGSACPRSCTSPVLKGTKQYKKQAKTVARMTPSDSSGSGQNLKDNGSNTSCDEGEPEPKPQAAMVYALQEIGGTVAQLSEQIKELMCKINKLA